MLACMLAILHNKLVHIFWWNITIQKYINKDFPGGPAVKSSPSNAGGVGSIPGQGANIQHALGPKNHNIKTEAML